MFINLERNQKFIHQFSIFFKNSSFHPLQHTQVGYNFRIFSFSESKHLY